MHRKIEKFVSTALSAIQYEPSPNMTLPDVFSLMKSKNQDPAEITDLVDIYLDTAVTTWIQAGGNPFWAVSRLEGESPFSHLRSNDKSNIKDKRAILQCILGHYRVSEKPFKLTLEEAGAVNKDLAIIADRVNFELIVNSVPFKLGDSIKEKLLGLNMKSNFINAIADSFENLPRFNELEPDIKNEFERKLMALRSVYQATMRGFLFEDVCSTQFDSHFNQAVPNLSEDFLTQLFNDCVDHCGEETARSLYLMFGSEDSLTLSNYALTRMTVGRYGDIDHETLMGQLRALGHESLGSDCVSKCLREELNSNPLTIGSGENPRRDEFWLTFVIDQMQVDDMIGQQGWPAILMDNLSRIEQIRPEKTKIKVAMARERLECYLRDNPQCVSSMFNDLLDNQKTKCALDLLEKEWPISSEIKDSIFESIVRKAVSNMTDKYTFDLDLDQYLTNNGIKSDPVIIARMGALVFDMMTQAGLSSEVEFESDSIFCVAYYFDRLNIDPEEKMLACKKIKRWATQKEVIQHLNLPRSLYKHLSLKRRGEMLSDELDL